MSSDFSEKLLNYSKISRYMPVLIKEIKLLIGDAFPQGMIFYQKLISIFMALRHINLVSPFLQICDIPKEVDCYRKVPYGKRPIAKLSN